MSADADAGSFLTRRRTAVVVLVIVAGTAGLLAWTEFARPPGPTVAVTGELESTAEESAFRGQLNVTNGRNVTLRGVQVQFIGDDRVLRTIRFERVDGSNPREMTVSVHNASISKVRIRFESVEGTDSITVRGLRRDDDGDLVPYPESESEYRYGRGR